MIAANRFQRDGVVSEDVLESCLPFNNEFHSSRCLNKVCCVHDGVVLHHIREQSSHGRKISLNQERRNGLIVRLKRDDFSILFRGEGNTDSRSRSKGLTNLLHRSRRHQSGMLDRRSSSIPGHIFNGHSIPVCRHHAQCCAANFQLYAINNRHTVFSGCGDNHL